MRQKDIPLKLDICVRYAPGINFIVRHDLITALEAGSKTDLHRLIWDSPTASIPLNIRPFLKEYWKDAYGED